MKNITITMDDAAAEWVRIEAARRNSSVSRMLGEQVDEMRKRQDAYERARQDWLGKERRWVSAGQSYPRRGGGG